MTTTIERLNSILFCFSRYLCLISDTFVLKLWRNSHYSWSNSLKYINFSVSAPYIMNKHTHCLWMVLASYAKFSQRFFYKHLGTAFFFFFFNHWNKTIKLMVEIQMWLDNLLSKTVILVFLNQHTSYNIHLILWFNTITCIMYKPLIGYIALYIHCIEI